MFRRCALNEWRSFRRQSGVEGDVVWLRLPSNESGSCCNWGRILVIYRWLLSLGATSCHAARPVDQLANDFDGITSNKQLTAPEKKIILQPKSLRIYFPDASGVGHIMASAWHCLAPLGVSESAESLSSVCVMYVCLKAMDGTQSFPETRRT